MKKPLGFETSLSVVRIYPKQQLVVRASRKVITFRSGAVPLGSPIQTAGSKNPTFSFIFKNLSWFDWTQHKKHQFLPTIELAITKVVDFIIFHIFDAILKIDFYSCTLYNILS